MSPSNAQHFSFEDVEAVIESRRVAVNWVKNELRSSSLPDKRLDKRFIKLTEELSMSPMSPIPEACGGWTPTKGAYRFLDNESCRASALLAPHVNETIERMKGHAVVLAVQDTVFYGFKHPNTTGLGPIGKSESDTGRGLVMHHTLALTTKGLPLGTITQSIWARDEKISGETASEKSNRVAKMPTEDKESWKWIEAAELTAKRKPEGVMVVTVCDREGDFYEFVAGEIERQAPFIVRARWNRRLIPEESAGYDTIMEALSQVAICKTTEVEIIGNSERKARTALVGIKFVEVTIKPPMKKGAAKESASIDPLTVRIVAATEIDPPKGEDAISWVLLTNLQVKNARDAGEKVDWYRVRWGIEVHHKVMKSGCRVELARLETGERLARYLAINSIIAFRLMHMTYILRTNPHAPCTGILSSDEIEALCVRTQKFNKMPGGQATFTMRDALREIAKIGGFLARKSDREPGIITIYRGFQRLNEDVVMLRNFKALLNAGTKS